ncbi:AAA family ATPase [Lysinibacillus boronitolerans]|uniref:AAA family ATPase n=1 Tax=Lysinibacillus boronitolerans TaxID=309788 RepID=UPI0038525AD3
MKFNVIYGPLKYFNESLPAEDTINLTELIRWSDARRNNPLEDKLIGNYENLVVFGDEYGGVTEAFIEMFVLGIISFQEFLGYSEVYLHNPPNRIVGQIERYKEEFNLEVVIKEFEHSKITKSEIKRIRDEFSDTILGQERAKDLLLQNLYDIVSPKKRKPKVIMLYGPPGVGKTETAHFINNIVNDGQKIFRKQFSMYHNDSFYSYIFGDRSNSFAKDLIERESNVILLDEFDKCNKLFYSAFYQLFDEGVFEDKYYEVNLDNAIFLCTSNYRSVVEIKQNLGEAIYSRFDGFVEYVELAEDVKIKLIDDIFASEIELLDEHDKDFIYEYNVNGFNIPELLKTQVNNLNNVREIRRYLKQMIATPLIDRL